MKSKIIYVDFIKKRRINHFQFIINKAKNYVLRKLSVNYTYDDTVTKDRNIKNIVNKIY